MNIEYIKKIDWPKVFFKYNPYLTKGQRKPADVKCFVKIVNSDKGTNYQLQFWYGKTLYNFDIIDANPSQEQYNRVKNLVYIRRNKHE